MKLSGSSSRTMQVSLIIIKLHRPRSGPMALGPAPLITIRIAIEIIYQHDYNFFYNNSNYS